ADRELDPFERRVADRNDVARDRFLLDRGRRDLRLQPVPVVVEQPVFPGDLAAHTGVGAVARADGVAVALDLLAADRDRYGQRRRVLVAGSHRYRAVVVAVLERELRAADPLRRIRLTLGEADKAGEQPGVDRILLDANLAELVATAGVEHDEHRRGTVGRV